METPAKTAISGGLISVLAIGAMATVGVLADPSAPPADAAGALVRFEDCDALQSWYVDHTIDQVGPYGWGGRRWTTMRGSEPSAGSLSTAESGAAKSGDTAQDPGSGDGVANGETGTNTQEAGVDEPDVAKTDGRIVVRLKDNQRVLITDVSGSAPREIADWLIPSGSYVEGLLLVGDHVLLSGARPMALDVVDDLGDPGGGTIMDERMGAGGSELIDLDISDPAAPRLDSRTSWSGQQLSLRQYGDTVRLVTSTGLPQLPFVQPRPGRLTEDEAEKRNREIVRDSVVEDWVPGLSSETGSHQLVACDEVYHPKTWSGSDTVAVATFNPGAVDQASAVAVTGAGAEVYSSSDRLYVTSTDWGERLLLDRPMTSTEPDVEPFRPRTSTRTYLHAFALEGTSTRYLASGSIAGTIRDRWSLDEHDGHLRVAVSRTDRLGGTRENGIVVLDERDGRLEPVGELRGLGVDEEIQSVRWFDDLAVLVTFRQMDPLYTIDLRDPAHPRELGALKIPGFSSYLHPIGDDLLLGIGTDATTKGQSLGAQVGVFDIADATRARQVGKATFGPESHLAASDDPHAFTWLPQANAAITSLEQWSPAARESDGTQGGTEMVLLRVSRDGTVTSDLLPSPGGGQQRALPLDDGRVALVGDSVKLVSVDG